MSTRAHEVLFGTKYISKFWTEFKANLQEFVFKRCKDALIDLYKYLLSLERKQL